MNEVQINKSSSVGTNTIFGVAASVTNVATRLITVPVVIHYLGLKGYGTWAIIMVLASYMRLGIAGAKSGFQKYVAEAMGNRRWDYANRLLSTGTVTILSVCVLGLIPLTIFSRKITIILNVPVKFFEPVSRSIVVLALAMIASNVGGVFEAIIMGVNRIDIAKKILIIFTVIEAIAIILFVACGYGLFEMTVVMATSEALRMFSYYLVSRRICPAIKIRPAYVVTYVLPELLRFVGSYQLLNILGVFYTSLLPLAMFKLYGAETAGLFALCERVVRVVMIFPEALLLPILTASAFAHGSGTQDRVQELVIKTFKCSTTFSIPLLCFLAFFGIFLIYVWTGTFDYAIQPMLFGVTIASFFCSIGRINMILYRSSGGATKDIIWMLIRAGLVIIGISLAGRLSGLSVILTGYVLAELFGAVYMFYENMRKHFFIELKSIAKNFLKVIAGTCVAISLCIMVQKLFFLTTQTTRFYSAVLIVVLGLIYSAIGLLYIFLVRYFSSEEMKSFLSLLTQFLKKGRLQ